MVQDTDSSDDEDGDCDDNSIEDIDKDIHDRLPLHLPCFAHTLQLVVRDGLKEAGQHLKTVISKAASTRGDPEIRGKVLYNFC